MLTALSLRRGTRPRPFSRATPPVWFPPASSVWQFRYTLHPAATPQPYRLPQLRPSSTGTPLSAVRLGTGWQARTHQVSSGGNKDVAAVDAGRGTAVTGVETRPVPPPESQSGPCHGSVGSTAVAPVTLLETHRRGN